MPNIKPISDLRNYTEVLHDVAVGAPVFLTKNGRGRYAIVDMQDYERTQATIRLMNELAKGRKSGETEGWLTPEDMRAHFRAEMVKNKIHYTAESRRDLAAIMGLHCVRSSKCFCGRAPLYGIMDDVDRLESHAEMGALCPRLPMWRATTVSW